jgi:hypothetical protein
MPVCYNIAKDVSAGQGGVKISPDPGFELIDSLHEFRRSLPGFPG